MSPFQKRALFTLVVIVLTLAIAISLYAFRGRLDTETLTVLGLAAFGPMLFRRHRGQIAADERDQLIMRRSKSVAYQVFWYSCVAFLLLAIRVYGLHGALPVMLIINAAWFGAMIFHGTHAIATLVQYGRGGVDARS